MQRAFSKYLLISNFLIFSPLCQAYQFFYEAEISPVTVKLLPFEVAPSENLFFQFSGQSICILDGPNETLVKLSAAGESAVRASLGFHMMNRMVIVRDGQVLAEDQLEKTLKIKNRGRFVQFEGNPVFNFLPLTVKAFQKNSLTSTPPLNALVSTHQLALDLRQDAIRLLEHNHRLSVRPGTFISSQLKNLSDLPFNETYSSGPLVVTLTQGENAQYSLSPSFTYRFSVDYPENTFDSSSLLITSDGSLILRD